MTPSVEVIEPDDARIRDLVRELARLRDDVGAPDEVPAEMSFEVGPRSAEILTLRRIEAASGLGFLIAAILLGAVIRAQVDALPEDGSKERAKEAWAQELDRGPTTISTMSSVARKIRNGTHAAQVAAFLEEAASNPVLGWGALSRSVADKSPLDGAAREARSLKRWTKELPDLVSPLTDSVSRYPSVAKVAVPAAAKLAVAAAAALPDAKARTKALRALIKAAEDAIEPDDS